MRRVLTRLWQLFWVWRERVVIYTYSPHQGAGKKDEQIQVFDNKSAIPHSIVAEFVRARGLRLWLMIRYRMIVEGAKFIYLAEEGQMWAYAWFQHCDTFPRRYRWLTPRGTLLSYFWTAPERRGCGLYGRLLQHCIAMCTAPQDLPIIVYADVTNDSSRHGLEKAGFARLGEYEVISRFLGLFCTHKVIFQERTISKVLAEG